MHRVSIHSIFVAWIADWDKYTKDFFQAAASSDNLELFKSEVMIEMINYIWRIMRPYFIWYSLVPFIFCFYIPMTILAFSPLKNVKGKSSATLIVQIICLILILGFLLYKMLLFVWDVQYVRDA